MFVRLPFRFRRSLRASAVLVCAVACAATPVALASSRHPAQTQAPAPIERRPPRVTQDAGASSAVNGPQLASQRNAIPRRENGIRPRGEHLADWMNLHKSLTPDQQRQALEREPGFQSLPEPQQQRMRERLSQLDAMSPEERRRLLARNEAMERLSPDQRSQVRGAMGQLGSLPIEQRRVVARTFRSLRDLPVDQRISAFNSGRYGPPMSDAQRAVLFNLLQVEPMLPPPTPAQR